MRDDRTNEYCLICRLSNRHPWQKAPNPSFEPGCTEYYARAAMETSFFYMDYVEYHNFGGTWRVIKTIDLDGYLAPREHDE